MPQLSPPHAFHEKQSHASGSTSAGASVNGSSLNRNRRSGLKSRSTQLLAVKFGWVVLIIWYEVGEFFSSLSSCKFPDSILRRSSSSYSSTPPTHVVLISDPHVPHYRLSHPPDSPRWLNFLRQQMEELFMRKSWNVVMRLGRIDVVIMAGDMLDWGRGIMSEQEYEDYFDVFRSIFRLPETIPMYFVPGNHDLPIGPNRLFSPEARNRYLRHFSPPNALLPIANHTLVLLDAIGLVEEDYRRYAAEMQFGEWDGVEGGVIEFVKEVAEDYQVGPKILISHIPLSRQDAATCGPLRERGRISKGAGPGYQNLLGSETSRFLLEELRPSIVFSGDDHDYCEHVHPGGIREVTIKSFSSSAGIRRPGFQLLSLIPPSDYSVFPPQITHADRPCFLPDQIGVYTRVYLPFGMLTIFWIFFTNIRNAYRRYTASRMAHPDSKSRNTSPYLASSSTMPTASTSARMLPSRQSSTQIAPQLINGGGALLRTASRSYHMSPSLPASSAPGSPALSPRPSFSEDSFSYIRDEEAASETPTPSISRRSSYVWMNGSNDNSHSQLYPYPHSEPGGYGGIGLGLSTPVGAGNGGSMQRSTSSTLAAPLGHPSRRVTMPRMLSATAPDWNSSKTNLSLPGNNSPGKKYYKREAIGAKIKSFGRWLWKTRNGVFARSWKEVLEIAWPAGVVWILVNLLFFF